MKVLPDRSTSIASYNWTFPPGVGDSKNKARPKRKPRPKKSARGAKK